MLVLKRQNVLSVTNVQNIRNIRTIGEGNISNQVLYLIIRSITLFMNLKFILAKVFGK